MALPEAAVCLRLGVFHRKNSKLVGGLMSAYEKKVGAEDWTILSNQRDVLKSFESVSRSYSHTVVKIWLAVIIFALTSFLGLFLANAKVNVGTMNTWISDVILILPIVVASGCVVEIFCLERIRREKQMELDNLRIKALHVGQFEKQVSRLFEVHTQTFGDQLRESLPEFEHLLDELCTIIVQEASREGVDHDDVDLVVSRSKMETVLTLCTIEHYVKSCAEVLKATGVWSTSYEQRLERARTSPDQPVLVSVVTRSATSFCDID